MKQYCLHLQGSQFTNVVLTVIKSAKIEYASMARQAPSLYETGATKLVYGHPMSSSPLRFLLGDDGSFNRDISGGNSLQNREDNSIVNLHP